MLTPTPPGGPQLSNYPRPSLVDDRRGLREIAAGQRRIIGSIVGQFLLFFLGPLSDLLPMQIVDWTIALLAVGLLIYMVISVIRLAKALGGSEVLYAILMFVPCVSIITLLVLSSKANTRLREAGIRVGFFGVNPKSIE